MAECDWLHIIPAVNRSNRLSEDEIAKLIAEIKQGVNVEENYGLIYRDFYGQVRSFFARQGESEENVSELTQMTFISVFRNVESFRGDSKFKTWILSVARNLLSDEIDKRTAKRRKAIVVSIDGDNQDGSEERPSIADILAAPSPDQLQTALEKERLMIVRKAINEELSPKQRECLELHLAGLSYKEIAKTLGSNENTVKATIFQAKAKLKAKLATYFEDMKSR